MAKKRLSRDQKRKAKLAERASRAREKESLAYTGNKYKTDELVPVHLATETAIYEAFVMTEREITDRTVASALEELIERMRQGPLPPLEDPNEFRHVEGEEEELIIKNIRRHWHLRFETMPHPGRENLIGVLRTILGSIKVWGSPSPQSRGYLNYIEGFLKKLGVSVEVYTSDMEPVPEPEEDQMLELGRAWCHDGDSEAGEEFRDWCEREIRAGEAERVVEVCQRLIGELEPGRALAELSALSLLAQRALKTQMG